MLNTGWFSNFDAQRSCARAMRCFRRHSGLLYIREVESSKKGAFLLRERFLTHMVVH
jgi:hypothetical protein